MLQIEGWLDGWAPSLEDYHLYEMWETFRILPYQGGWLDQPDWVQRLFNNCGLWDEWLQLNEKLPSTKNVPSFDMIAGG